MSKIHKRKINVFGKKIPVLLIAVIAVFGIVTAALIPYFGQITGNATVTGQGLLVDGESYPASDSLSDTYGSFTSLQEKNFLSMHNIKNNADANTEIKLLRDCTVLDSENNCDGVDTVYYKISTDNIIEAANRLVATQNSDGGWDWNPVNVDPSDTSPKNTIGVTGLGLIDAYKLTENSSYIDAAEKAAGYIESSTTTASDRIRGPDITFLVELSEVTENSHYADVAKAEYEDALTNFGGNTATGLAEYIKGSRLPSWPTLVSWDINLYVQGVLSLDRYFPGQGYANDAEDMTEVIYNFLYVESGFNFGDDSQSNYWLTYTGAIDAFTSTSLHISERDSLVSGLVTSQDTSGYFKSDSTYGADDQTTAYAIMALIKVQGQKDSVIKAANYLVNSQDSVNGGWSVGSENMEVTSEAIQTLLPTEELVESSNFGIASGEKINFLIGNYFPKLLVPDTYTITTTVTA